MICRLALIAMLATLATGCAFRTPAVHVPARLHGVLPNGFSPEKLDVTVIDHGRPASDRTTEAVRKQIRETLAQSCPPAETAVRPPCNARVDVRVEFRERYGWQDQVATDGIALFGMWGVPFGQQIEHETAVVDLVIVRDAPAASDPATRGPSQAPTLRGRGIWRAAGSIYAPARRRALARATDVALANAGTDMIESASEMRASLCR